MPNGNASQEIKKILMVDDEEGTLSDFRKFLQRENIEVVSTTRLDVALKLLKDSFLTQSGFDIVVIDMALSGQVVPSELMPFYNKITPAEHNEGQALGRWLWDEAGAHKIKGRPIHFYFSNLPDLYVLQNDTYEEEFFPASRNECMWRCFVVDKLSVRPSNFFETLKLAKEKWIEFGLEA